MHKIVVGIPSQEELMTLNDALSKSDIKFKLWIEMPENIPSCLALKPYSKSLVEACFKGFKLLR